MADRIKGITVEIGGDTTGLSKALSGINKEIKNTQSQLKDVTKLLKLDPTNTTLLAQQQKLLATAVDETKKKLSDLKSVQDQMDAGLKNGSVTQQQYDAWQREIVATEEELKNLQDACKKADTNISATLKAAGSKIQEVGGKISGVGDTLTKTVTGPIVGIGAASLAAFKEVDDGLDTVEQKTGASGAALEEMNQIVKNLATEIPTDFSTAGAAVGEVSTRFGLTGDALDQLSGKFIKFSQLNNTDVSASVDSVSKVLEAFGEDGSNASALLDAMNVVGQKTGMSMDDLAANMQKGAAQMRQMGYTAEESAAYMSIIGTSGLEASTVMTGLQKASKKAASDGKSLNDELEAFDLLAANSSDQTEILAAAYELFGAKSGAAIAQAVQDGSIEITGFGNVLGEYTNSVENTFNATLDPIDQFQMTLNSLKETGADIGNSLATVLAPVLKDIAGALKSFSEVWKSIPEPVQSTIVKIALLAATIGPVLGAGGKIITAVGTITSALGSLSGLLGIGTAATTAAGAAATATGAAVGAASIPLLPIIGIIAAIVAAVIGVIEIIKHWGEITQWFGNVWKSWSDGVVSVWDGLTNFFTNTLPNFFTDLGQKWSDGWNAMKTKAGEIWDGIKTKVGTAWDGIKERVANGLANMKATTDQNLAAVKAAYDSHGGGIKGTIAAMMEGMKIEFRTGYDFMNNLTNGKLGEIANAFHNKMSNAASGVRDAIQRIKSFFNFSWHLPNIQLPHFSISGQFSLNPPSIPHIGVSWYEKAMKDGMILNSPTIFGASGNTLLGAGEAGAEAIIGVNSLQTMIKNAVAGQTQSLIAAMAAAGGSTPVFQVYVGNDQLDNYIVFAQNKATLRSGGR